MTIRVGTELRFAIYGLGVSVQIGLELGLGWD